jgi:hypothetical protein
MATAWNPAANGWVHSVAPTGSVVYAGGDFTSIGGQSRNRIGALTATTGLATAWNPGADGPVYDMLVTGGTVCAGGYFFTIGGKSRNSLAALDASTGLATGWDAGADGFVLALGMKGSSVCAAGDFMTIGGQRGGGFAVLRPDASAPVVEVLALNGGGPPTVGALRQISWSATDDLAVQSVDLHLSRTGPAGPWELVTAAAPNTGTYLWTVTGPEVAGNDAYLRVDARDYRGNIGTDVGDSGFSIEGPVLDAGQGSGVVAFALTSPAPNPTTCRSLLTYSVPLRTRVRLVLLDVQGRKVASLVDGLREAGRYTVSIAAADLHPGIYFVRMQAGSKQFSRRMVVLR